MESFIFQVRERARQQRRERRQISHCLRGEAHSKYGGRIQNASRGHQFRPLGEEMRLTSKRHRQMRWKVHGKVVCYEQRQNRREVQDQDASRENREKEEVVSLSSRSQRCVRATYKALTGFASRYCLMFRVSAVNESSLCDMRCWWEGNVPNPRNRHQWAVDGAVACSYQVVGVAEGTGCSATEERTLSYLRCVFEMILVTLEEQDGSSVQRWKGAVVLVVDLVKDIEEVQWGVVW